MSTIEITAPTLPESVANAEVTKWYVQEEQQVAAGDRLASLDTDKVGIDVTAPEDGFISKIIAVKGATVLSEEVIAIFTPRKMEKPAPVENAQPVVIEAPDAAAPTLTHSQPTPAPSTRENKALAIAEKTHLGPKARRLIMEHGVNSDEVEKYLQQKLPPHLIALDLQQRKSEGQELAKTTRVPMTKIRKRIAERLLESKNSTAMLTTFNEVDLSKIMELRKKYGEAFQKKHGIRLGFMSFFVKAVSEAMKEFPIIGACIDGDDVIYYNTTDISIAVSTERGLVTPVLRSTELMSLADVERTIANFAKLASDNKLTIEDITGGNFTITNGGVFGSLFSTPIINPPQSAILGMHGIVKRPVAVDDQVVIRPMMYIALSYDHRLIDGRDSVRFLVKVRDLLQDPEKLLLEL